VESEGSLWGVTFILRVGNNKVTPLSIWTSSGLNRALSTCGRPANLNWQKLAGSYTVTVLGRLNVSIAPKDMSLPGLDLHPLKGDRKGTWAVKVSGNWRITFTFVGKDADAVDYEDYH
jgi:plasmid maintenance system killer protein